MTRGRPLRIVGLGLCVLALSAAGGCDRIEALTHGPGFDKNALESALDPSVGGPDTCVVIDDTQSGVELYRYGSHAACDRPLTPCATFDVPMALIGVDQGLVDPKAVWKYAGEAQPVAVWRRDAALPEAFDQQTGWWWARLATMIGPQGFARWLPAFGYGPGKAIGPIGSFWMGPTAGGATFISTAEQAVFLHKLYTGALPVKPASADVVRGLMKSETVGDAALDGVVASCPSIADNSRNVGWWIGRIKSSKHDLVFAISIEGQNALPGFEIRSRVRPIFQQVGLLPAG